MLSHYHNKGRIQTARTFLNTCYGLNEYQFGTEIVRTRENVVLDLPKADGDFSSIRADATGRYKQKAGYKVRTLIRADENWKFDPGTTLLQRGT